MSKPNYYKICKFVGCNKPYIPTRSNQLYCHPNCRSAAYRIVPGKVKKVVEMITVNCAYCGKPKQIRKKNKAKKNYYCNKRCMYSSWRENKRVHTTEKIKIECVICHTKFPVTKRINNRICCDKICEYKHKVKIRKIQRDEKRRKMENKMINRKGKVKEFDEKATAGYNKILADMSGKNKNKYFKIKSEFRDAEVIGKVVFNSLRFIEVVTLFGEVETFDPKYCTMEEYQL